MVLLVDVGNSNIVFGLSGGNTILKNWRLKTFLDKSSDELYILIKTLINDSFDDVMISSVVPVVTSALNKMFTKYYQITPMILGPGVKTGVMLQADDPKSVGADMICDVAGAYRYFEKSIIVDMGTATKYIYQNKNTFMGVAIAPGVSISMKALVNNAALLPSIELQTPNHVLGHNTISCMQSGIIYGAASQVDGMITRIKEEIKDDDIKIIATGGLSKIIVPLCKHEIVYNEVLVLDGLLSIYNKNKN